MKKFGNKGFLLIIVLITGFVEGSNKKNSNPRIINKFDSKRQDHSHSQSGQNGEVVYEDEGDWQSGEEDFNEPWIPPQQQPPPQIYSGHHIDQESIHFGSLQKRFGSKIFGEDFVLFLVLLTIAGFFGLIISMLMPFTFLLSNGGVIPLGLGGINGLGGLGGINGLGGLQPGLGGFNNGFIGRKKRSKVYFKEKLMNLLALFDKALEKHSNSE